MTESVNDASPEDLEVSKFMSAWTDPDRKWFHVGGDLEASYDGARYIDFRQAGTNDRLMFISLGALEDSMKLFSPEPKTK